MAAAVFTIALAIAPAVGAVNVFVRVTGGTRITATGQTGSRLINHTGSQTFTCAAERAEGALRASDPISRPLPVTVGHRMSLGFTSCVLVPGIPVTVSCAHTQFKVTGLTVSSVTPASLPNIACDIRLGTGTTNTCHVTTANAIAGGSTAAGSYLNTGTFTVDQSHTNVGLTGTPARCAFKNTTSARFQNSTGANLVYNVTPAVSILVVS
jgi:hypothetical protein